MKLHDLKPAPGSRKARRRVGRGIAAGQGKTAGRGTKGQKARAGGSIPAWFEGGQTPLHQRIPKLHGFRNPFRVEYEVVNLGSIAHLVELGVLEPGDMPGAKKSKAAPAPITVNQEILRAAGLVRTLDKPLKILGAGELSTALFVVADAFSASARTKIEAAGGTVSVLEVPARSVPAMKGGPAPATVEEPAASATSETTTEADETTQADDATTAEAAGEPATEVEAVDAPEAVEAVEAVDAPEAPNAVEVTEAPVEAAASEPAEVEAEDPKAAPAPKKPRARKPKAPPTDDEG